MDKTKEAHIVQLTELGYGSSLRLGIYPCIEMVRSLWPMHDEDVDIFLSYPYLRLIQSHPPDSIRPIYGILRDEHDAVVALYYFQTKHFRGNKALNYSVEADRTSSWLRPLKRMGASVLNAHGLILGNLLVTGQHGISWQGRAVDEEIQWAIHRTVCSEVKAHLRAHGHKCSFMLCKDYVEDVPQSDGLPLEGVKVQPRMLLQIRPHWKTMEDYLGDMTSKYRKRNRAALRKMGDCMKIDGSPALIHEHADRIYELYLEIVKRAPFNMFILKKQYFSEIKSALGDRCRFTLYFMEDQLVAFQINLINERFHEAHFLGYDFDRLKKNDLYLNLLLHTVSEAIELGMPAIDFSRTAMQIKSSIGAVPEDLYLYVHGHHPMLHKYFAPTVRRMMPVVSFDMRHPFKD